MRHILAEEGETEVLLENKGVITEDEVLKNLGTFLASGCEAQ